MGEQLEFGLLGPLRVDREGTLVPISAGRQRALLAALLLNRGQLVYVDDLIEVLWELEPPTCARASLHNYVSRLRAALGISGRSRILTEPRGYVMVTAADEVDVFRFEALLTAAQAAMRAGAWDQAAAAVQGALSLWRGRPLADVKSDLLVRTEVPRLTELRLQALEAGLEADLHLGRQAGVIPELRQLITAHPLREQLYGLLMLALYGCGRQAEALATYQNARQMLLEELGAEPSAGLRELHQQILAGTPVLARGELAGRAVAAAIGPAPAVPRTLPGPVSHFAGRQTELAMLASLLDRLGGPGPGAAVMAIAGTAGVGKTALAVHWGHQVSARFPDGQLYVNLRGYDPGPPMRPGEALAGFLRTLGVPGPEIPAEPDERATRYRSMLAERRMLVLLDNAASAEQVRPLLPATTGCLAVVTSRDALAGLVARDGACRIDLDLLPLSDAIALLGALIGGRAVADPDATRALAEKCDRLPLALRVAAERAAANTTGSLPGLVAELANEQGRLDVLAADGDPRTAVRSVFSWSCRLLDPEAARAFRLTALHPGDDLDVHAAAALTGTSFEQASGSLGRLVRACLIQSSGPPDNSRYGRHDLLRAYARELTAAQDTEADRRAALIRLFDYYLHTAAAAANALYPGDQHRRPAIARPAPPIPSLAAPATAQAWLDAERANLTAVAIHAATHGWPDYATRLAVTLFRYLDTGGHISEAIAVHTCARRAARAMGDRGAEAEALTCLGGIDLRVGRYSRAAAQFRRALALFRATGDRSGAARSLANLGVVLLQQGSYPKAIRNFELAAASYSQTGDRFGQARVLANLGTLARQRGHQGQAVDYHRQALVIFRAIGDRASEACALTELGDDDLRGGRCRSAARRYRQSLTISRETAYPAGQVRALNGLGEAFRSAGQPADARSVYTEALGLAGRIHDQYEQARARDGLGQLAMLADVMATTRAPSADTS